MVQLINSKETKRELKYLEKKRGGKQLNSLRKQIPVIQIRFRIYLPATYLLKFQKLSSQVHLVLMKATFSKVQVIIKRFWRTRIKYHQPHQSSYHQQTTWPFQLWKEETKKIIFQIPFKMHQ